MKVFHLVLIKSSRVFIVGVEYWLIQVERCPKSFIFLRNTRKAQGLKFLGGGEGSGLAFAM